jgi:hypothetical protein
MEAVPFVMFQIIHFNTLKIQTSNIQKKPLEAFSGAFLMPLGQ